MSGFLDKCSTCLRGLHGACTGLGCTCTHEVSEFNWEDDSDESLDSDISEDRRTSRHKRDDALKDQQSTGRKRAAKRYPFNCRECGHAKANCICDSFHPLDCEWRGNANCGGGHVPILGCTNGLQTDRHHGPDKAVTNNEPGNVHRICTWCHHTWHAKNNPKYDWSNTVFQSHAPRPMTEEEKFEAAVEDHARKQRKIKRIKD